MELTQLTPKTDVRGTLVEAFQLPNDGLIVYLTIAPGEMRGNHYHLRKTESFIVVAGSAIFNVKNRETGDILKVESTAAKPLTVAIHPNYTHNIEATDEGCIILTLVSEQYNPDDPDTYPEEI